MVTVNGRQSRPHPPLGRKPARETGTKPARPPASGRQPARRRPAACTRRSSPTTAACLRVSALHELYYEESGNPRGKPVVFLHGGPGGGTDPTHAPLLRSADATASCCSTSAAAARSRRTPAWCDNTTWHLVADIESAARAPRHRALAGVRRLVGLDARARLRRRRIPSA